MAGRPQRPIGSASNNEGHKANLGGMIGGFSDIFAGEPEVDTEALTKVIKGEPTSDSTAIDPKELRIYKPANGFQKFFNSPNAQKIDAANSQFLQDYVSGNLSNKLQREQVGNLAADKNSRTEKDVTDAIDNGYLDNNISRLIATGNINSQEQAHQSRILLGGDQIENQGLINASENALQNQQRSENNRTINEGGRLRLRKDLATEGTDVQAINARNTAEVAEARARSLTAPAVTMSNINKILATNADLTDAAKHDQMSRARTGEAEINYRLGNFNRGAAEDSSAMRVLPGRESATISQNALAQKEAQNNTALSDDRTDTEASKLFLERERNKRKIGNIDKEGDAEASALDLANDSAVSERALIPFTQAGRAYHATHLPSSPNDKFDTTLSPIGEAPFFRANTSPNPNFIMTKDRALGENLYGGMQNTGGKGLTLPSGARLIPAATPAPIAQPLIRVPTPNMPAQMPTSTNSFSDDSLLSNEELIKKYKLLYPTTR